MALPISELLLKLSVGLDIRQESLDGLKIKITAHNRVWQSEAILSRLVCFVLLSRELQALIIFNGSVCSGDRKNAAL
jgi:hypothetical protein